jgi:hypothetical protein
VSSHPGAARRWTTVQTPHVAALAAALEMRDQSFEVLAPDRIGVRDIAPDDLGWLAAAAGVVVYEMVTMTDETPDPHVI